MSSVRIERDRLNLPVGNEGAAAPRLAEAGAGGAASPAVDPALLDLLQRLAGPAAMPDGVLETGLGAGPAVGEQLHALLAALAAKGGAAGEAVADRGDIEFEVAPGALVEVPSTDVAPLLQRLGALAGREGLAGRQARLLLQAMSQALDGRQQQEAAQVLHVDRQWARQTAGPLCEQVGGPFLAGDFGDTRPSAQSLQRLHSECDGVDINALVQWVLRESYLDQLEDLRFFADKVRFFNEQKQAVRDVLDQLRTLRGQLKYVPSEATGTTDLAGNSTVPGAGGEGATDPATGTVGANAGPTGVGGEFGGFTGYDVGTLTGLASWTKSTSSLQVPDHMGKDNATQPINYSHVEDWVEAFFMQIRQQLGVGQLGPAAEKELLEHFQQNGFTLEFSASAVKRDEKVTFTIGNATYPWLKPNGRNLDEYLTDVYKIMLSNLWEDLASKKTDGKPLQLYDITLSVKNLPHVVTQTKAWEDAVTFGSDAKSALIDQLPSWLKSSGVTATLIAAIQGCLPLMDSTQVRNLVFALRGSSSQEAARLAKDIIAAATPEQLEGLHDALKPTWPEIAQFLASQLGIPDSDGDAPANTEADRRDPLAGLDPSKYRRLAEATTANTITTIEQRHEVGRDQPMDAAVSAILGSCFDPARVDGLSAGEQALMLARYQEHGLVIILMGPDARPEKLSFTPAPGESLVAFQQRVKRDVTGAVQLYCEAIAKDGMRVVRFRAAIHRPQLSSVSSLLSWLKDHPTARGLTQPLVDALADLLPVMSGRQIAAVIAGVLKTNHPEALPLAKDILRAASPEQLAALQAMVDQAQQTDPSRQQPGPASHGTNDLAEVPKEQLQELVELLARLTTSPKDKAPNDGKTGDTTNEDQGGEDSTEDGTEDPPPSGSTTSPETGSSTGSMSGFVLTMEPPYVVDDPSGRRITTVAELDAEIGNLESKLNSIGDDAQLANVDLQNMLQKQQQLIQMMSSISKLLADTAQAVIRKIG